MNLSHRPQRNLPSVCRCRCVFIDFGLLLFLRLHSVLAFYEHCGGGGGDVFVVIVIAPWHRDS